MTGPTTGTPAAFFSRLAARAQSAGTLLCVGLDPVGESADALRDECLRLIDLTADYAAAFKPNCAFFEAHGPAGLQALQDVIAHVPAEIPVVLDAKRGDIAHTSAAYARAAFDTLGAAAITLSPYVGSDGLAPFLARPQFGAFVLCKTSNAGADELQALQVQSAAGSHSLYETVARQVQTWSQHDNVGLVVGATDPAALARVRALAPELWFLVPGIGAQGGSLASIMAAGLRADRLGLLINVSRAIGGAADPRAAAKALRDEIMALARAPETTPPAAPAAPLGAERLPALAAALLQSGCVQFGKFTLKSGIISPIYLDLRRLVSYPAALHQAALAYADVLQALTYDRLAGIPYAALPIATAIGLAIGRPVIYPRREAKEYGTKAAIEGEYNPGETAVMIDDLATTGGTKIEAAQKLEAAGLLVRDIVVLIDREQGAGPMLAGAGYQMHAVARLHDLLAEWRRTEAITQAQFDEVRAFLDAQEH